MKIKHTVNLKPFGEHEVEVIFQHTHLGDVEIISIEKDGIDVYQMIEAHTVAADHKDDAFELLLQYLESDKWQTDGSMGQAYASE